MRPQSQIGQRNVNEKEPQKIKICGSYFVPEVRTVCALLKLNNIDYEIQTFDIFDKGSLESYNSLNPTEQMPTIIEGFLTIVGDAMHIYRYLCNTKEIDEKFYPTKDMNLDKKKVIDSYLTYIQCMVKRNVNRITKLKTQRMLLSKEIISRQQTDYQEVEEGRENEIFYTLILPNIEEKLEGNKLYLCGYDYTIADIALYNEIQNAIEVIEQHIDAKKFPNLERWMKRIGDIGAIQVIDNEFDKELKKYRGN